MSDLTPEQEAEVAALLAEVGGPVAMPADVAARLDGVLAGLVAEEVPATNVVPIRARRWPKVLVAAAAVSLFGYAGGQLLQGNGADSAGTAAVEGAAPSVIPNDSLAAVPEPREVAGKSTRPDASPRGDEFGGGLAELTQATALSALSAHLQLDASLRRAYTPSDKVVGLSAQRLYSVDNTLGRCDTPPVPKGSAAFEVSVRKHRVVVVLHRASGSAVLADVYPCRQSIFPVASELLLGAR
jgi:hypothetical protein